jgi:hypothetical protein
MTWRPAGQSGREVLRSGSQGGEPADALPKCSDADGIVAAEALTFRINPAGRPAAQLRKWSEFCWFCMAWFCRSWRSYERWVLPQGEMSLSPATLWPYPWVICGVYVVVHD